MFLLFFSGRRRFFVDFITNPPYSVGIVGEEVVSIMEMELTEFTSVFLKVQESSRELLAKGLREFARAIEYAQVCNKPCQEFSQSFAQLNSIGLRANEIRLLFHLGLVEPLAEVASEGLCREFRPTCDLFGDQISYQLTKEGLQVARSVEQNSGNSNQRRVVVNDSSTTQTSTGSNRKSTTMPCWNSDTKVLKVADVVVKSFRVPAPNQSIVLRAFQEENWPRSILDPLPPSETVDPKSRIRDTIRSLNKGHMQQLIRFHGNGTGQGIYWRWLTEIGSKPAQATASLAF